MKNITLIIVISIISFNVFSQGISVQTSTMGYKLSFSKKNSDKFVDFLDTYVKEEEILMFLIENAVSNVKIELKLVAAVIAADVILFKYKFKNNRGYNGVIVEVWGPGLMQKREDYINAILPNDFKVQNLNPSNWAVALLPAEWGIKSLNPTDYLFDLIPDKYKDWITVATTLPVYWEVSPK